MRDTECSESFCAIENKALTYIYIYLRKVLEMMSSNVMPAVDSM
jgi:hypothetical protein